MVTIKDIAKEANVSITTVSRVLNNYEPVNANTKRKIFEIIEKYNYTPSMVARGMRKQETKIFGVLIPDFMNFYYSELIKYIESEANKKGYRVLIASTKNDFNIEREYIEDFISRKVDGVILCRYQKNFQYLSSIENIFEKIPIIMMDQPADGLPISTISADAYKGFRKLTKHLIERGHSKIAMLRSYKEYSVADCRFQGYIDELKENNIKVDDKLILECNFTAESAYSATKKLLINIKPSAIIGSSDLMAIGAMQYILGKGYNIPKDIAIAGYDNIELSKLVTPRLTTVKEPIKEMAKKSVELLIRKKNNPKGIKDKDIILDINLIIREST